MGIWTPQQDRARAVGSDGPIPAPPGATNFPTMAQGPQGDTLVDHFRAVLLESPEARTFRFLVDGEGEPLSLTNAELDRRARAIAATLRERVPAGERALIVCPPGLDYVASFLGCLYAGVIAVPVYPPNPVLLKRTLPRLVGVIADAHPAVSLAPASIASMSGQFTRDAPALGGIPWQTIDELDLSAADSWEPPQISGSDIAFLQYTSGSTGQPKGVVLSHANLLSNLDAMKVRMVDNDPSPHQVVWLPPYHDMGLICGLLLPAYAGFPVTFMSPLAFLKRPGRWLRAISDAGGTFSGAPDFAYELCVAKVSDKERETLDLSTWTLAFSGAEPVRAETLDRFARAFEPCGFRRKSLYPVFGLAEGTLLVSGGDREAEPVLRTLQAEAYRNNKAVDAAPGDQALTAVGCGYSVPGHDIVIVDPELLTRVAEGSIGEIWTSGPSIAIGYWGRPEETKKVLQARLADSDEGPFLRTGDLGFLEDGELFITGRIKDLIIIAGQNHYPQDVERTVEAAQPALRPGCGVAFTVDLDNEERLVIVYEVARNPAQVEIDGVISTIRATVAEEHGLQVHDVVLLKRGKIPKTSSGKLRRRACRTAFLEGRLQGVFSWSLSTSGAVDLASGGAADQGNAPYEIVDQEQVICARSAQIEQWLADELARRLEVAPESLDLGQPFANYGMKSVDMVGMVGELERWLGGRLPATLMWEFPTIERLASFLSRSASADVVATPPLDHAKERPKALPSQVEAASETTAVERPLPQDHLAEPIAIIGIGCRFPGGVDGPESFWQSLCDGRDSVIEVPADRWKVADFLDDDPSVPGKTNTRWGGFIDGMDGFDPQFFGISPREASQMDPQQRLLAKVAWEALEDAGVSAERVAGSLTGVFVGIATSDYGQRQFEDLNQIDAYSATGIAFSIAANRLSYLFDLRGPSIALDTACSSSLVAVHQACLSLAQGDCSMAIAGGVNLVLSPALAINFSKAGAMAPDGRCKSFDARADGYVRSEGAGLVVLKPLAQALADNDSIYGVIRGGAVNQDGRTNGLMAPNPQAQETVIRAAYRKAGLPPQEVQYVEAHGSGTLLGDPIEARGLSAVVAPGRDPARPCLIGSVKSNLGHLEAAAGIAGLIKVALMMRNRMVPPSLHFQKPNPHISFEDLGLRVAYELQQWPSHDGPAVAGVSAFGFGGTNAHLVVQEAPAVMGEVQPPVQQAHILTISARNEQALRDLAAKYEVHLSRPRGQVKADSLCAAAAVRRTHQEHRLACVGSSPAELREALGAFARDEDRAGLSWGGRSLGRRPKMVFVFSGQGPKWWAQGPDLTDSEPVFREVLERCDALLRRHTDWSLIEQLSGDFDSSRLGDSAVAQPALCALQVALATLWRSWGIEPVAVVGHSVGEIAAAHISGALSLEDALRVALERGRVIRSAAGKGKMAVAGVSFQQAQRIVAELGHTLVCVAGSNGPTSTVLSGESEALESLAADLEADGTFCRVLSSVDFASHSPQMDPLRDRLKDLLVGVQPRSSAIPMISSVTGTLVDGADLDAEYWAQNLRQPVLFDRAVTTLVESGHETFVEISPHPMLGSAVEERMAVQGSEGAVVASMHRGLPGRDSMLGELGRLYCAGYPVDWTKIYGPTVPMVTMPTYAWQDERYWLEDASAGKRRTARDGHPMLETFVHSAAERGARHWCTRIDLDGFPYLRDHCVGGSAVLPASVVLETALAASHRMFGSSQTIVEDVRLTRMTVVQDVAEEANLQLVVLPESASTGSFQLFSNSGSAPGAPEWMQVAQGRLRTAAGPDDSHRPAEVTLAEVRGRCQEPVDCAEHYASLNDAGLQYGPSFQGVHSLWRGENEAVARLHDLAELTKDRDAYLIHPALLDSCLQALAAACDPKTASSAQSYVPVAVGSFTLAGGRCVPRWAHASVSVPDPGANQIDGGRVVLFDDSGAWAGEIDGITLKGLEQPASQDLGAQSLLEVRWTAAVEGVGTLGTELDPGAGWWLLFADRGGVCADLQSRLAARGGVCVTVTAGEQYSQLSATHFEVCPSRPEDLSALFEQLGDTYQTRCAGVVHAWSLDASLSDDSATEALWTAYDLCCVSVLLLVQSLTRQERAQSSKLLLATRGAQHVALVGGAVIGGNPATALAQSALWGLAKVISLENGELRPTIIDLDPDGVGAEAAELFHELLRPETTEQLALRGGTRYLPTLEPWTAPSEPDVATEYRPFDSSRDANCRILAAEPGILESLTPTIWKRARPGPGEVEIEVAAAGLNFMDVLKAMDICPGVPPGIAPLGAECAGRVTAVGEGVDQYSIGDPVMAVAPSSMASFATTPWQLVAPRPDALDDEQAAATPIAFLTVVYGLEYLARLGEGDKILIHSATGGVGLAALQVARRNGAEVFATAGTEEKRDLLCSWGVKHAMDSRSLLFADEIMELTDGHGVDVVLNSLTGEALTRSLSLLAPNGRFVEIGKQDIYSNGHLGLGLLKHNRSFLAVDLERLVAERPALVASLFSQVVAGFESGEFSGLPVTSFAYSEAADAFAHMAKAQHIGKIVLRPDGHETIAVPPQENRVRACATYLITGGLGALGLETATYLVDQGARHLALLGRHRPSDEAELVLEKLRSRQVEITVFATDIAQFDAVTSVLAEIDESMPPLAGIVHAAGILDDGLLLHLDQERFRSVAEPKVAGAWHLHRATQDLDLDFFVLFSSAAALLGSPGQGNYGAANAFMDSLALHRHSQGLPALSINWGPWSEIGLAAGPERGGALSSRGILSLTPQDGMAAFGRLLFTSAAQVCVLPLDRDKLRAAADGGFLPGLLTNSLASSSKASTGGPQQSGDVRQELLCVEPGRRRVAILTRLCTTQAARVLKLDASKVDTTVPLASIGFDSLMSLELRKRLESSLSIELPATVAWRFPTIDALVPFLAERMGIALQAESLPDPTEPGVVVAPDRDRETNLEQLPDTDVEALLLAKMMQIDEGRRG